MKLLCRLFGHKWFNLWINFGGTISHRECKRCGYAEEITTEPAPVGKAIYRECKPRKDMGGKYGIK